MTVTHTDVFKGKEAMKRSQKSKKSGIFLRQGLRIHEIEDGTSIKSNGLNTREFAKLRNVSLNIQM